MLPSLSIAIVTFAPRERLLARTLASLGNALAAARARGSLGEATVCLVDNGPEGLAPMLESLAQAAFQRAPGTRLVIVTGQGNVGFGRGHNLALARVSADFHLVLNPDVEMDETALHEGLRILAAQPGVGALTPAACGEDGERQYLVKDYPSVQALFARGFLPAALRGPFRRALAAYELRHLDWAREQSPVTIASGCFLLCRRAALDAVKGFDPRYFLYFEDFDLTLRLSRATRISYAPQVRIVHHGGGAASKGLRHVGLFARSAKLFFGTHGWRWRQPG